MKTVTAALCWRSLRRLALPCSSPLGAVLVWAVLGGVALPCSAAAWSAPEEESCQRERPNVVVFFTDDQGTLDANCYGSTDLYTPTMDRLAEQGIRFTRAYAHIVCCPSRAMLMTGRYPQRSDINMWAQGNMKTRKGRNLLQSEVTLAEALQTVGYKTALFGKWHLGAHADHGPTAQGFDQFFGLRGGFIDNYNHFFLHKNGFHDLYEGTEEVFAEGKYFPDMVTERALQFIDQNRKDPFLLVVAFNIPHYPEQADAKFDERYREMPMPRQSYAKIISTTDDRMGQIMARLDQHGLTERTVVVFMSDNGHSAEDYQISGADHVSGFPEGHDYGAHGGGGNTGKWLGQKNSFLEGGIRVPAILSYPAELPRGVVRDQVVTAMDWMPTVLALCQVPPTENRFDGQSLLPMIHDEQAETAYDVVHWQWGDRWAVMEGDWKLIGQQDQAISLGNLSDSQPEALNYLEQKPLVVEQLLTRHQQWAAEVKASRQDRK
ncbi:MAG: sulfatase-like hydrolase/transferase [Mariniblastus sp.]|nr:sulfatase-like hydrolase/transferase [Mariniblastus sp.]